MRNKKEGKEKYRGFEIWVYKDPSNTEVHYLISRMSDGVCIVDGLDMTEDTAASYIKFLKERIDDYIKGEL